MGIIFSDMARKTNSVHSTSQRNVNVTNRKILIVTASLRPLINHRMHLLDCLSDLGNKIFVMGSGTPSEVADLNERGITTLTFEPIPHRLHPIHDFQQILAIRRAFQKVRPDIVNIFATKTMTLTKVALLLTNATDRPQGIVYSFAGLGRLFSPSAPSGTLLMKWLFVRLIRSATPGSNAKITIETHADLKTLKKELGLAHDTYTVTHGTGIDTNSFTPVNRSGPITFLYAGRLLKEKGAQVYLDAVAQILRDDVECRFLMAGFRIPGDPDALPESSIDRVRPLPKFEFLGDVKETDMPALFKNADVICLPSNYMEGIPRILLEACSSGCTFITTRIPGWLEVVQSRSNCGWFIKNNSSQCFADAVRAALRKPEQTRKMGGYAREMILQSELEVQDVQEKYLSAYAKSLA